MNPSSRQTDDGFQNPPAISKPRRRKDLLPRWVDLLTAFFLLVAGLLGWQYSLELRASLEMQVDGILASSLDFFDLVMIAFIVLMAVNVASSAALLLRLRPAVRLALLVAVADIVLLVVLLWMIFAASVLGIFALVFYIRELWRIRKAWAQAG